MAKINPVKVKQDADKLEKANRFDQAIELYKQLVDDNPRDWNTINKIGDLYARLNRNREASEQYAKVADFYAKDGFLLKAIAIWKKIDKLDATALEPKVNLGELYAKQGLMMEAKTQYQAVVDEYVKRGRSRDAAEVLRKMVDIDPGDLKTRSKLADLYTREGSTAKAVEEYVAIADELNKKGHLAEGLQVLEKGLKLDPKSQRLREELARIHLVQKNYDKAAHFLEEAVQAAPRDTALLSKLGEAYLGARKIEEAEAIFKRLLELNPQDQEARVQMGRVHVMQGQLDRAFEELAPVVDKLVEKREFDRAASILQQLVQKNASHEKSLVKLVDVYRQAKNDRAVSQTYTSLAEAYVQQKQFEQAVSVLEILVGMEPQNQQFQSKLQFVRDRQQQQQATPPAFPQAPARPAPAAKPAAPAPAREEFVAPEVAPAAPAGRAVSGAPIEASGPLSPEDKEFVEEHLAEGRVFHKYGLIDKAIDQFESVVARFPDNAEARVDLRDVYEEKGSPEKAGEQALALIQIARLTGDETSVEQNLEFLSRVAPDLLPAAPTAAEEEFPVGDLGPIEEMPLGLEEEIPLPVEELATSPPPDEVEVPIDLGVAGPEEPGLAELGPSEELPALEELPSFAEEPPTLGEELPALGAEAPSFAEDLSAPGFGEELPALGEELPSLGEELPGLGQEPGELGFDEPAPGEEASPFDDLGAAEPPSLELPFPGEELPPDLARTLSEVEEYISLGFVDDARVRLRDAASRHPEHPALLQKIAELGVDLSAAEAESTGLEELAGEPGGLEDALGGLNLAEPAPSEAPAESGMIDLGAELSDLFGTQSAVEAPPEADASTDLGDAGLSEIFREFRKGVDKQLGKEDYDTRYNLGIAYKEMGLIDEAIAEFQLAAKDEARLLECSSMLGICFLEKGMAKLAVKWFEKGLTAQGRAVEEYQGLRYDLASALESAGEANRALALFTELYGQDASFRDVAAKVRELGGAVS